MSETHAEILLAKIEAYLEGSDNIAIAKYTIAGRALEYYSLAELINLREYYRAEVAAEATKRKVAAGAANKNTIRVKFN